MAKSHAPSAEFRLVLRLFALFAPPTRVIIFQRLARQPATAGELARSLPISRSAVVQHLKLLEAADLVGASFQGKRRVYQVRRSALAPLARWLKGEQFSSGRMPGGPTHKSGVSRSRR